MENEIEYMVCTECMTYNHSLYIVDTMDGFVLQQTDFPVVYTIVDDASKDQNPEILKSYFFEHFDHEDAEVAYQKELDYGTLLFARHLTNKQCYFAVLLLKENHYSQEKSKLPYLFHWIDNSTYYAICEGDDYWTDPLKLQKQVDILENNPELMAVVTNSSVVDKEKRLLQDRIDRIYPGNVQGRYSLHDFFRNVPRYPTATVMFRNIHMDEILKKVTHTQSKYLGDWTLWAILHSYGDFYYLDEVTAAYRINPTSLTHTADRVGRAKAHKTICKALSEVLPAEYSSYLKEDGWMYFAVFMAYRKEKKYPQAIGYLLWCLIRYPIYTINELKDLLKKKC